MGLEKIIIPDLNVKNFEEVEIFKNINPIWEKITPEQIELVGMDTSVENYLLFPDLKKPPNNILRLELRNRINDNTGDDNHDLNFYLENLTSLKLLERKITKTEFSEKQINTLENIINIYTRIIDQSAWDMVEDNQTRLMLNVRLNNPDIDLSEFLNFYKEKRIEDRSFKYEYENLRTKTRPQEQEYLWKNIQRLSYMKILMPYYFKDKEFKFLVQKGEEYINEVLNAAPENTSQGIIVVAAGLKVLAADEVRIGDEGFEFEFINVKGKRNTHVPLPDRRKF